MKNIAVTVVVLFMALVFVPQSMAGQEEVLRALERVKAATLVGSSLGKYTDLLIDAQAELNILGHYVPLNEKGKTTDPFFNEVGRAIFIYTTAKIQWEGGNNEGVLKSWNTAAQHIENAYKYLKK